MQAYTDMTLGTTCDTCDFEVTLVLAPSGLFTGTKSGSLVNGVLTFEGLMIGDSGIYNLRAKAASSGSLPTENFALVDKVNSIVVSVDSVYQKMGTSFQATERGFSC